MIITPAACAVPPAPGAPRLDGRIPVRLKAGSRAAAIYGVTEAREEFHCSFGLDPKHQPLFERGPLRITGHGESGEARIVELDGAAFYIGTLFMPQLAVTPTVSHPLIEAFLRAAAS